MTRVKICGVTTDVDRERAITAGADAVGVISDVDVDTPREVSRQQARDLLAGVPPFVTGVLVTMASSVEEVVRHVDFVAPDAVQIHHGLTYEEVDDLVARVDVDVLVGVTADDPDLAGYAGAADALLLDAKDEAGGGGTGTRIDWDAAEHVATQYPDPVVLAGGLTPDNVAEAVERVGPYGVDVASGVERADPEGDDDQGRKDDDAVRTFVRNAKRAAFEVSA